MKFETNRDKGNTSLGIAIDYYASNGYIVSIPLNDTQDYDLIVDKESLIKRVQVKSTGCKTNFCRFSFSIFIIYRQILICKIV